MSAATSQRRVTSMGDSLREMPGLAKVLRGVVYHRGCLIVGHNDRQMPYPTGGFNSPTALADGGPLQVAGADADGGLRIIAKQPSVQFQIINGAALTIEVSDPGPLRLVSVVCPVASTTANAVAAALRANTDAALLLDVAPTGTGAGFVAAFAAATIPWVRILGLALNAFDSSAWPSGTDEPADPNATGVSVYVGELGLEIDDTAPPVAGQQCWAIDNQTVTANYAALTLPMPCIEVRDGQAMCRLVKAAV